MQEMQVQSLGLEIPWRREWVPTQVFLAGESQGQRRLVGHGVAKSWTQLSDKTTTTKSRIQEWEIYILVVIY